MKLVSAAKLKRAQEAAAAGRLFSLEVQRALLTALENLPEGYSHPFINPPKKNLGMAKRRVVLVSGERGLSGPFNANNLKAVVQGETATNVERDYLLIGKKGVQAAARFNWNALKGFESLPEDIGQWPVEEIVDVALQGYADGEVQEIVLYYTQFISTMTQKPTSDILLPLNPEQMKLRLEKEGVAPAVAKLDPSPEEVFEYLAPIYIRSRLREAGLESKASEHAARMTAMDSATNNASDLIERLRLFYNRARQSSITTELIDIIGGASAVE